MSASIIQIRLAIVIVAVADMLVFARATGMTLVALAIGTATVFLGSVFSYRQASVMGLLVISGAAASAIEISTLTEIGAVITAGLGLVVPVIVLTLASLSSEGGEAGRVVIRRGPAFATAGYIVLCLLSVPVVALLISLFAPGISTNLPTMAEGAILLVITIAAGIALTWREPRNTEVKAEE